MIYLALAKNGRYIYGVNKKPAPVQIQIAIQSFLRPAIPAVCSNKDFDEFKRILVNVDRTLTGGHLEEIVMDFAVERLLKESPEAGVAEQSQVA